MSIWSLKSPIPRVAKDREVKFPLYARAGILEAWLINVDEGRLEVHRQPRADGYQAVHILQRGYSHAPGIS